MSCYRQNRAVSIIFVRCQRVTGSIEPRIPTDRLQLIAKPFRALLFKKCGCGDAAQLQVPFVDPRPLAREPALCFKQSRLSSQVRDSPRVRREPAAECKKRSGL